jgi:predicted secreted hydrolase
MKNKRKATAATLFALIFSMQPMFAQYKPALPGYHYEFPRDYFNHPDYQTEWWYYTGNLQSDGGHKFGFELTFFRTGVSRDRERRAPWDVRDLYFAHFAISDLQERKFVHSERSNRSGPGIAGADAAQQKVWNGNWSAMWVSGREQLNAVAPELAIHLSLQSQKPPVVHGENGISQKSAGAGRASHYFSETRLQAAGELEIASTKYRVTGLAWMDHEFFTEQLGEDQAGWDWLSVQLDDHTELMLFHIRKKDGSIDPYSAGTFVDAQGRSRHLGVNDFQLEPAGEHWSSPESGAKYPVHWRIRVPSLGIVLDAATLLPSQEFAGNSRLAPTYWEGAIMLSGSKNSAALRGMGYLEMTGYDRPVQLQ